VKTTNFWDCFWDWITADDTGERFWYAKRLIVGVVVFLFIPILIYFVVKWDPVIGIDEEGEPTQLGVYIIIALYWVIAYFSYRRHLDKLKLTNEVRVDSFMILHIKGIINPEAKNKLLDKGFERIMRNVYNGSADWNHNIDKDIQIWKIVMNDFNYMGYLINMIENDSDFEEVIWTLTKDEEI
jgi:hypothetical protein